MSKRSPMLKMLVIFIMALGLVGMASSGASAQIDQDQGDDGQCQEVGDIDQCQGEDEQCQDAGDISQCQCPDGQEQEVGDIDQEQGGDDCVTPTTVPATATKAPATATTAPATATTVPATATTVPGQPTATTAPATNVPATNVPVAPDDDEDTGGQAEEPIEVDVLPETGQGPADGGQSNTTSMLLLGAMGMVLTLAAVAMRLRKNG